MNDALVVFEHAGERILAVLPTCPPDAPAEVREGIRRRWVVTIEGTCPCGGMRLLPSRAERRLAKRQKRTAITRVAIEHEDDCPALDATLKEAIVAWKQAAS